MARRLYILHDSSIQVRDSNCEAGKAAGVSAKDHPCEKGGLPRCGELLTRFSKPSMGGTWSKLYFTKNMARM